MQSLLLQLLNSGRQMDQKFYLVVVPDDEHPRLLSYDTVEDMLAGIRQYLDTPTSLFPLLGVSMQISKGPNRFLITPFGNLPLFVLPTESLEVEVDGYVGVEEKSTDSPGLPDNDGDEDEPDEGGPPVQSGSLSVVAADDESPVLPLEA